MAKGLIEKGTIPDIHFASGKRLAQRKADFFGNILSGDRAGIQQAGFTLHAIEDVHGAHKGLDPIGHALSGHKPDRIIGDQKFIDVSNEVFQVLKGDSTATLTTGQIDELIRAVLVRCGQEKKPPKLDITLEGGGGGGGGGGFGGGIPFWMFAMWDFLNWVNSIPVGGMPESEYPEIIFDDEDNPYLA
jgi:hypothetical protein